MGLSKESQELLKERFLDQNNDELMELYSKFLKRIRRQNSLAREFVNELARRARERGLFS